MATAGARLTRITLTSLASLASLAALAAGLVAGLAVGVPYRPAAAQATGQSTPANQPGEGRVYLHPDQKFSLSVPPGARLIDPGGRVDVSIRSAKGYAANVQTGAVNFSLDLPAMVAKLEAAYLGPDKTWQRKTGERSLKIAGLPAYDALYEGANVRARVVVVRGARTDFVFIFLARPGVFDSVTPEFDGILSSFRPAAGELAAAAPAPASPRGAAETMRRFQGPAYAIDYPADWTQSSPRPDIILFKGQAGAVEEGVAVAIQDVAAATAGSPGQSVARVVMELKSQLAAGAGDVVYLDNGAFAGGGSGWQFQVVYTLLGERMRQRSVIVAAGGEGVVYIWTYAAPSLVFERYRPIAETMLATWTLKPL